MAIDFYYSENQTVLNAAFCDQVGYSDIAKYWQKAMVKKHTRDGFVEFIDASRLVDLTASTFEIHKLVDEMMQLYQCGYIGSVIFAEKRSIRNVFHQMIENQGMRYKQFGSYMFICATREDFALYCDDLSLFIDTLPT